MALQRICLCITPRRGCILVVFLALLSALFYLTTALYVNHVAHCGMKNVNAFDGDENSSAASAAAAAAGTPVYAIERDGLRSRDPVYISNDVNAPVDADYIESCRSPWAAHTTLWKLLFSAHLIMCYVALIGAVLLTLGLLSVLNGFLFIFLVYAALEVLYRIVMTCVYGYFIAATPSNTLTILSMILLTVPIPLWIWGMLAVYAYTHDVSRFRAKVERQRDDADKEKARELRFSQSYRGRAPSRAASVVGPHARKLAEDAGYVRISISEEDREKRRQSIVSANAGMKAAANNATLIYNSSLGERKELLGNANGSAATHDV